MWWLCSVMLMASDLWATGCEFDSWPFGVWRFTVGVWGWKLYSCVPKMALPIHLFRQFCGRMYHLATVHNITDRRHYDDNSHHRPTACSMIS